MEFTEISINNFRNFKEASIRLSNKNVIFGMNDIGKTNFLYAIRFLLDPELRRQGFSKTDFNNNDISNKIEIVLTIDLSDFDNEDTQNLIAATRGVRKSPMDESEDKLYVKLESEFNEQEQFGNIILKWGSNKDELEEIPIRGNISNLDRVFKVFYINPLVNLDHLFNKYKKYMFENTSSDKLSEADKEVVQKIKKLTNDVNERIGELSKIKEFQTEITGEYQDLRREDVEIELRSEMAIKGFYSDIIPYIKKEGEQEYFPTSGDGRRKMLSYSIYNYLARKRYADRVVVYLIEEPEISLHRSMQISLSQKLFTQNTFNYFFMSTHSSEMLYEMDNTRLIRVHSKEKINCSSYLYNIDDTYQNVKKKLNRSLGAALFAERVLLIEGPSEKTLFEKVLSEVEPDYELDGGYILEVGGTYFHHYVNALKNLKIDYIIKTDNDLKSKANKKNKYELLGLNRCLKLIDRNSAEDIDIHIGENTTEKEKKEILRQKKLIIYKDYGHLVDEFESNNIYLSEIDLENDLYSVIGTRMEQLLGKRPVQYLQDKKLFNMVELISGLDAEDCAEIYNHKKFSCLKMLTKVKPEDVSNVDK